MQRCCSLLRCLTGLLLLWCAAGEAQSLKTRLDGILQGAKGVVGISVLESESGKVLYEHNAAEPYQPASVLKVVTTAAALGTLNPDYTFATTLSIDHFEKGAVGNLYVQGGGDPSLTSENMWILARVIKRRGIERIGNLNLDDARFVTTLPRAGARAYETGSSALSFNFNNLAFEVCPGRVGKPAQVSVDPWEADVRLTGGILTEKGAPARYDIDEVSGLEAQGIQTYRLRGSVGSKQGCETIYRSVRDAPAYFGVVLRGYLKVLGVKVGGERLHVAVPERAQRLFTYTSKPLSSILEDLNHYSNNFIAEQVLTAMGCAHEKPCDRERGLAVLVRYLNALGVDSAEFRLLDGSGLSHENRISARVITRVLYEMQRHEGIKPEFEKSLSVAGRNGTLKKRRFGLEALTLRGKTGTLDGVSSLAGYLIDAAGKKICFAILQNNVASKDDAMGLEEKVVGTLYRGER